jgi:predicted TIM-barrel fold metal-dependent hydrolase
MIVDIHSHVWAFPDHFSAAFRHQASLAQGGAEIDLSTPIERYWATCPDDETVVRVVFGGKAKLSGLWVDDAYVAQHVSDHRERLLGFLALDPTRDGWQDEMRYGHQELGLCGIKIMPMYAGFMPQDERLDPLWQYATDHGLPVLLHTGTTFVRQAPIACTSPRHLDEVAIRFPDVKIIMAHFGHPFEGECIAVARKHANVYTDISALHYRPFQFFRSLMLVQEYGIWPKVLFGTDFPFTTVNATLQTLGELNDLFGGRDRRTRLNEDGIDAMIHRDTLKLLGLPQPATHRDSASR